MNLPEILPAHNTLLSALPADVFDRLYPNLKLISMDLCPNFKFNIPLRVFLTQEGGQINHYAKGLVWIP